MFPAAIYLPRVLIVALVVACCGCDSSKLNRGAVQGRVTFDGEPVEMGGITFVPTDGNQGPVAGGRIRDGSYAIAAKMGPVIGPNRVEISANRATGNKVQGPEGALVDETVEAIPAWYNTDSRLVEAITQGKNPIDFDLKSAAPP